MPGRWAEQVSVDPEKTWDSFIQFPYVFRWSAGGFPNDPAASTCSTGGLNCRVLLSLCVWGPNAAIAVSTVWAKVESKWLSLREWPPKWIQMTTFTGEMKMNQLISTDVYGFPVNFQTNLSHDFGSFTPTGRERMVWDQTQIGEWQSSQETLPLGPSKAITINHHQTGYALVQHGYSISYI